MERSIEKLRKYATEVADILVKNGYTVDYINYPSNPLRRSIDIVATSKETSNKIFIRVVAQYDDIKSSDIVELSICGRILHASPLIIVAEGIEEELEEITAHSRLGVYIVSLRALEAVLKNSIYIVRRSNYYYMRVNGKKFRERREQHGYSLGDMASLLNVSRKSVYLYEQESMEVGLHVALKIIDVLGDEVFKPIPILQPPQKIMTPSQSSYYPIYSKQADNTSRVINIIKELGGEAHKTKRAPPDVVAKTEESRMIIVMENRKKKSFEHKVDESIKLASHTLAEVYIIVSDSLLSSIIRKDYDYPMLHILRNSQELRSELLARHARHG